MRKISPYREKIVYSIHITHCCIGSKFPTYPHHVMPVQVFTPTNKWNVWLTHKLQARELHPLKMPCTTAAHTVRVITLQNEAFKKCSLNTRMLTDWGTQQWYTPNSVLQEANVGLSFQLPPYIINWHENHYTGKETNWWVAIRCEALKRSESSINQRQSSPAAATIHFLSLVHKLAKSAPFSLHHDTEIHYVLEWTQKIHDSSGFLHYTT